MHPTPTAPLHILLAEQDDDIRGLFAMLFGSRGHTVSHARNAVEALDCVERQAPDVVFSSLVFGDLSGFELCRRLRSMPQTAASLIVALTGYTESGIQAKVKAAGFDRYFLKPAQLHEVLDLLAQPAAHRQGAGTVLQIDAREIQGEAA